MRAGLALGFGCAHIPRIVPILSRNLEIFQRQEYYARHPTQSSIEASSVGVVLQVLRLLRKPYVLENPQYYPLSRSTTQLSRSSTRWTSIRRSSSTLALSFLSKQACRVPVAFALPPECPLVANLFHSMSVAPAVILDTNFAFD